jgi:type III secretion system YscD/HrpQ family protein
MPARLVAEEGALKGLVLALEDSDQWVIGRDPDACQLLIEDPSTSRKHLICRTTPQGIEVENLSSSNPILINEEEVKEPRILQNGDAVKIGTGMFRFYAEDAAQLIKDGGAEGGETSTSGEISTSAETSASALSSSNAELPDELAAAEEEVSAEPAPKAIREETISEAPAENAAAKPAEQAAAPAREEEFAEKGASPKAEEQPPETAVQEKQSATEEPIPMKPALEGKESEKEHTSPSIFDEETSDKHKFSEINFGMLETGRWLLKVVGGPNNGAEFSMQTGISYLIGTDPNACDVVFHDNSVSRQHVRITIGEHDEMLIEDLNSRNGTVVDGESLKGKRPLSPNTLVSVGTTSFIVFDREGEMQTIISPLMPSIVKDLKQEETRKIEESAAALAKEQTAASQPSTPAVTAAEHAHSRITAMGAFILIGILTGLFVIAGIGTSTLFKSVPIVSAQTVDPVKALDEALAPFPSVKYSFNKSTGQLMLVGHVVTDADKRQLMYTLQGMKFIHNLNDIGVVIDEFVWKETNQTLENYPAWKGITVMSTTPGHFVVTGYLKTRAQSDSLSEYLNANFPYPELLEKRVIVDQDVSSAINNLLQNHGFQNITPKFENGEVTLVGNIPRGQIENLTNAINSIKEIPGVRVVRNLVVEKAPDQSVINISDKYEVTGISNVAGKLSVVINGRIVTKGDILDGMTITAIYPNYISLEKEDTHYRIDFNG